MARGPAAPNMKDMNKSPITRRWLLASPPAAGKPATGAGVRRYRLARFAEPPRRLQPVRSVPEAGRA